MALLSGCGQSAHQDAKRAPQATEANEALTVLPSNEEAIANDPPTYGGALPKSLTDIARIKGKALSITSLTGRPIIFPLEWISRFKTVWRSEDGRFVGLEHVGDEAFGYSLIDRAGAGDIIATGVQPVFSPSGKRFAAVSIDEAGWGNFEGIGIWQVEKRRTLPLFVQKMPDADDRWVDELNRPVTPDVPYNHFVEWRFEGWVSDDAAWVSALAWPSHEVISNDEAKRLEKAPRVRFLLTVKSERWVIRRDSDERP